MTDFIRYAEEEAERQRAESESVRLELIQRATGSIPSGRQLIEEVALSTSTDFATVQEEYWSLLHSGKLRLSRGTAVEST